MNSFLKTTWLLFFVLMFFMLSSCRRDYQIFNQTNHHSQIQLLPGEAIAKGFVFHDKNNNAIKEKNEKGIPNVLISNGKDLVKTDRQGFYKIKVDQDSIVFYIKPKNWIGKRNHLNLPQFYYNHKPKGSPKDLDYEGVKPTGPLPENINFPLYPSIEKLTFKTVVFGDPQPYSLEDIDFFAEDIVNEVLKEKELEFGITMGDIVGDNLDLFHDLNEVVAKVGVPWYNVLGNHDINFDVIKDELSDETFERTYGPPTYAFVYGNVHFIILDNVIYPYSKEKKYIGGLREDYFSFLENYLQTVPKSDLVVLNMHIPLAQHGDTFREKDQKKLFDLLKDFPNTLSISAHTHTQNNHLFKKGESGWSAEKPHHHFNVGTSSGSWWRGHRTEQNIPHSMMRDGTPNGYALINFDKSNYVINWKAAGKSSDHKMSIHIPRNLTEGNLQNKEFSVNYYMGFSDTKSTKVYYRFNKSEAFKPMKQIYKNDPFYVNLLTRYPSEKMPKASNSTHIWTEPLKNTLKSGIYHLEVKVKDRDGREFFDHQLFRISKNKVKH